MIDYDQIINRYRPRGWRIQYSYKRDALAKWAEEFYASRRPLFSVPSSNRSLGLTNFERRVIYSCRPLTNFSLQVVLHEIAHVRLEHIDGRGGGLPEHRQEYEADRYAINLMRLEGVPINRAIRRAMARYTIRCILDDMEKGIAIDPHVLRSVRNYPWPKE